MDYGKDIYVAKLEYKIPLNYIYTADSYIQSAERVKEVDRIMRKHRLYRKFNFYGDYIVMEGENTVTDVVAARWELQANNFFTDDITVCNQEQSIYVKYATYGIEAKIDGSLQNYG